MVELKQKGSAIIRGQGKVCFAALWFRIWGCGCNFVPLEHTMMHTRNKHSADARVRTRQTFAPLATMIRQKKEFSLPRGSCAILTHFDDTNDNENSND
eukprot:5329657-Amphidinium_carterae.1